MAKKKLSIGEIIFWMVVICWLIMLSGLLAPKNVDAQTATYCPNGHEVTTVNKDIKAINHCPVCGAKFPCIESFSNDRGGNSYQRGKQYRGPKVFGRGYHRDMKYDNKIKYSRKNNWNVSPDGNSGSISSTTIRSYQRTIKGEYGTLVGPGDHYGYGY